MMRRLAELTRVELAAAAPGSVLVLPFGAVEQHGPHLPFGTDLAVVERVAGDAAGRAGQEVPIVLAPAQAYGSSHHHLDVGGALSLSADAFAACARDLFRSAAVTGFRRAFAVNGHGGNEQPLRAAAAGSGLVVGGGSYWTLAASALAGLVPSPVPGHAGRFETSLALALGTSASATPPFRRPWGAAEEAAFRSDDPERWRRIDGYTDDPAGGSADEGVRCLEAIVAAVAGAIVDFHRWAGEGG